MKTTLSYIIVTCNRREPLLKTLRILHTTTPASVGKWETWVVDNGSTDGTVNAVGKEFPDVKIISRTTNEGVWARSYAFKPAHGEYVILLDDDSYPIQNTAKRSIDYLSFNRKCAAVVGQVVLPDGSLEACAYPTVMLSGAVCIRRSVLMEIGGFRPEFFRKAGEYDLSFRLWNAGYSIKRFEDIVYRHDKVATGRSAGFAHRMDLRNNLILVERYLPASLRKEFRADWRQRYAAVAKQAGHSNSAKLAMAEAMIWRVRERFSQFISRPRTLSSKTIETIFQLQQQAAAIKKWSVQNNLSKVAIADFGKNIYATYSGCKRAGLTLTSILDPHPAFTGLFYRNIPILDEISSLALQPEGIVISNINPAQVDAVESRIRKAFKCPVLRLWQPTCMDTQRKLAA